MNKIVFDYRFFFLIVLFVSACSISAHAQCSVNLTITNAAINPGNDNTFSVQLAPAAACVSIPVTIKVIDPFGVIHEFYGVSDAGAQVSVSYLSELDNVPDTDESGRYYVIAESPDGWDDGDFVVNLLSCENAHDNLGNLMAEVQVTIGSVPEMKSSDIVACCNFNCCYDLTLDSDCNKVGGNFPLADITVGLIEPSSFNHRGICHKILSNFSVRYSSINSSKYLIIGEETGEIDTNNYWIIDIGPGGCILGDVTECGLTTKRLLIDEAVYRAYVVNNLTRLNPICRGLYVPEIPWPYSWEQNTSRYLAVYGDFTDFLYCWQAPELIRKSKWCHAINLKWYSVVNLTNKEDIISITREGVGAQNIWNNLSGYIVLGHACPLMRDDAIRPAGNIIFDATAAPFNIPCTGPFHVPCGAPAADRCIYVWTSLANGSIGYNKSFTYNNFGGGPVILEVANSSTDTQIPAFNLTEEEIKSIQSNISADVRTSTCGGVVPNNGTFGYGPPYRSCAEGDLDYYRLFSENTTWVKIFAVTPMLEDKTDIIEAEGGWYWNWTRTSAPDNRINVTFYIGGGCKRVSAYYFDYPGAKAHYETPISDYVNVTVFDGMNPPVTYNVSGWNLLPFPPADSITNRSSGNITLHHPYEGIRYSYFVINHTIPDNAAYLRVEVNYSCNTTLRRNATLTCGAWDEVNDTSTVYDNFTIKFLDHENPKDNCRWTNPLEWINVSGNWSRVWDAVLEKHILYLNLSATPNRVMVSAENVSDNKTIEVLVRGNAAGDTADTTVGFYSNKEGDRYWFLDLHEEIISGGMLAIGYRDAGPPVIVETQPTTYMNNQWFWVKIYITNSSQIFAKIWPDGGLEPVDWQINYSMNAAENPFGYYWIIGTENGDNNEEFWFDPDPSCGINITGYYDLELLAPFGYSVVTGGMIEIRIEPDILSGFVMKVGETPRVVYSHVAHPAKHIVYRKEKAVPAPPYPDLRMFDYNDEYGYRSPDYGFNELCDLPPCPSNCHCAPANIFTAKCEDLSVTPPETYIRDDCVCPWNECYDDPCTSFRHYHEFEGVYYDFVWFYNRFIDERDNYFHMEEDDIFHRWILTSNVSHGSFTDRVNSPQGVYTFSFSAVNINDTAFVNEGQIIIYTHFRNLTYNLSDVLGLRGNSDIFYATTPPKEDIGVGDLVTVDLTLMCGLAILPLEEIEIIATNYQNELIGVSRIGDRSYVTSDLVGNASFGVVMRHDAAHITLRFDGNAGCGTSEKHFIIGGEETESVITSFEFVLLIIIFFLVIFSYRFFKRGRLDFYDMWQEFRGEKD